MTLALQQVTDLLAYRIAETESLDNILFSMKCTDQDAYSSAFAKNT